MSGPRKTVSSIVESLPLTNVHYVIVASMALGCLFDAFDIYVVAYAMPSIIKEWQIDPVTNGMLASAGLWGMFLGAVIWGPVGDRFGRKPAFILTLLGFSLLTGLTAFTRNVVEFGTVRFLTGMCLGGMLPVDFALTSEMVAMKHRGKFMAILCVAWPFGLLAAAAASLTLVPTYGWRVLFYLGALPALMVVLVLTKIPESPRWLAMRGRKDKAVRVLRTLGATEADVANLEDEVQEQGARVSFSTLLRPPYRNRFLLTTGYYFFGYFGYYGFALWLPTILATVHGLSLAKTFTYTLFVAIAAIVGRSISFWAVDKWGRKQLFYVGFGATAIASLVFGLLSDPVFLVVGACLLSLVVEIGVAGTVIWTPELYPSSVRATATALSTGAGRISSALAPIVFGFFMKHELYYGIFVCMAVFFVITVVLVRVLGVETKGKSLEEVGAA